MPANAEMRLYTKSIVNKASRRNPNDGIRVPNIVEIFRPMAKTLVQRQRESITGDQVCIIYLCYYDEDVVNTKSMKYDGSRVYSSHDHCCVDKCECS